MIRMATIKSTWSETPSVDHAERGGPLPIAEQRRPRELTNEERERFELRKDD